MNTPIEISEKKLQESQAKYINYSASGEVKVAYAMRDIIMEEIGDKIASLEKRIDILSKKPVEVKSKGPARKPVDPAKYLAMTKEEARKLGTLNWRDHTGIILHLMGELAERLNEQQKAIKEMVEGGVRYRGTFQRALNDGDSYKPGDVVTHSGRMWTMVQRGMGVPGSSEIWQLSQKEVR